MTELIQIFTESKASIVVLTIVVIASIIFIAKRILKRSNITDNMSGTNKMQNYGDSAKPNAQTHLRSKPILKLSLTDAVTMLKEHDFHDTLNLDGKGIQHEYEPKTVNSDKVVIDHVTGLTWQQSGSTHTNWLSAEEYIAEINNRKFAGFNDWRLPTLEEAMSLREPERADIEPKRNALYLNPIFDHKQDKIWTADEGDSPLGRQAFFVNFRHPQFSMTKIDGAGIEYVRAVRSGIID